MSKLVLVGKDGMLGRAWVEALERSEHSFGAYGREEFDITKQADIDGYVCEGVQWVINCASWTDVDAAEEYEEEASQVNGRALGELGRRCARVGACLVHYSTDYVFDGTSLDPYAVDAPLSPINAYGRSKALGEEELRASGAEYLLIRTSWLYAPWGNNFVRTIFNKLGEGDPLRVVDDQFGRPSSAERVVEATLALLDRGARGVYHVSDSNECSWYELAHAIAEYRSQQELLQPCTTQEYARTTQAIRPARSILDLSKTEALIGPLRSWKENLRQVLERIE